MGREIRRVTPNWEHPQRERCPHTGGITEAHRGLFSEWSRGKCFRPMHDQDYKSAVKEWKEGFMQWERGEHQDQGWASEYWEYAGNPPKEENYRPIAWTEEEATHYQVYETVSDGTPISPIFENLDQLVEWLIQQGYSEKAAKSFSEEGYAPSMVYTPETGFLNDIESLSLDKE